MSTFEDSLKTCTTEQIQKLSGRKRELTELKSKLEKLNSRKERIKSVKERYPRKRPREEENWLTNMEKITSKIQEVEEDINRICTNAGGVMKLIDEIAKEAEERCNETAFGNTLCPINARIRTKSGVETPAPKSSNNNANTSLAGIGAIGNSNYIQVKIKNFQQNL